MDAINKSERNTSIINFSAVYLIIIAIPVCLAFFAGNRRNAGAATSSTVKEYESLEAQMANFQSYTAKMRELDDKRANMGNASPEQWQSWLSTAKQENQRFANAIEQFRKEDFKESRAKMQTSICTYLDALHTERNIHIEYLERDRAHTNQSTAVKQLETEKQQLQAEKQQLQNTINTQNAIIAQKPAAGGGGGADNQSVTDLKWQLRFEDADCKKSQADMLAAYSEANRRKQLYSTAKVNFQQIAQLARTSYAIQRLASAKVKEIDQTLSRL